MPVDEQQCEVASKKPKLTQPLSKSKAGSTITQFSYAVLDQPTDSASNSKPVN